MSSWLVLIIGSLSVLGGSVSLGWLVALLGGLFTLLGLDGLNWLGFTILAAFLSCLEEFFSFVSVVGGLGGLVIGLGVPLGVPLGFVTLGFFTLGFVTLGFVTLGSLALAFLLGLDGLLWLGFTILATLSWLAVFFVVTLGVFTLGFFTLASLLAFLSLSFEAFGITGLKIGNGVLDVGIGCTGVLGGLSEVLLVFVGWLLTVSDLLGDLLDLSFDGGLSLLLGEGVLGWLLFTTLSWLAVSFFVVTLGVVTLGVFTLGVTTLGSLLALLAFLSLAFEVFGITVLECVDGVLDVFGVGTGVLGGSLEVLLVFLGWLLTVSDLLGDLLDLSFDGGLGLFLGELLLGWLVTCLLYTSPSPRDA